MNAIKHLLCHTLLVMAILTTATSNAQDRLFTYTYQSSTLNKGERELESWNTMRAGKKDFYARYDNRTEYEIGLGSKLQTAFYLNLSTITNTVGNDSVTSLAAATEIGFSNEWKLKLLDPVADPVGLALYGEFGVSGNEFDLEGKVILDKNIGDLTIAFNGVYEYEFAPDYINNELKWDSEHKLEGYLAFAYALNPRFHLTLENAVKSVFFEEGATQAALFSGLGVSYSRDNFWINFTAMPQLTSLAGATGNNLNLDEYEKIQFRLLFSFAL